MSKMYCSELLEGKSMNPKSWHQGKGPSLFLSTLMDAHSPHALASGSLSNHCLCLSVYTFLCVWVQFLLVL